MEKIEMDVYKSLEMIFKIIKPAKIAELSEIPYSTLLVKQKKTLFREKELSFSTSNVAYINSAYEKLGMEISKIRIKYKKYPSEDCLDDTRSQMLQLKEYFQPSYFYGKLGKSAVWYAVRMKPYDKTRKNCYFSEEDVLKINLAIVEASNLLLSIRNMIPSPNS